MSRKSFELFSRRDSGCRHTIVYIAGNDGQDKTIQLEDKWARHTFTRLQSKSKYQRLQSVHGIRTTYLACCVFNA